MRTSLFRLNAFALLVLLGFSSNARANLSGTRWDIVDKNFTVGSGDYIRMTGFNGDSFILNNGNFYHNDSTMDFDGNAQIGFNWWGNFYQNGGQMNVGGYLSIARYGGSGYLEVNGGTVNSYNHNIIVGEVGTGYITMKGGYAYSYQGVTLGANGGSTGNLSLDGGTLEAGAISKGGGTGNLGFNGGTLKATQNAWDFISGLNSANIYGNGAVIDNNGKGIGINQTLTGSGSGSVIFDGSNWTTLRQNNTYTGDTLVRGGVLQFYENGSLYNNGTAAGNIYVNSGATLFFNRQDVFGNADTGSSSPVKITLNGGTINNGNGGVTGGGVFNNLANLTMNGGTLMASGGSANGWNAYELNIVTVGGTSASTITSNTSNNNKNDILLSRAGTTTFNVGSTGDATGDLKVSARLTDGNGVVGSLTKTGAGKMVLSSANIYTGETKVLAGTLVVNTGGSIASSSTIISSGATVQGAGSIAALTVESGGVVKITTASTSTTSTSTTSTSTATAWYTGGSINFNSGSKIDVTGLTLSQQPYVLIRGSSVTGIPILQGATGFTVSNTDNNSVTLTPIPTYTYTIADGQATITKYNGTDVAVVIPASIGGSPVTKIEDHAFENNGNLTAVTIPQGVTNIGGFAFAGCGNMTDITLPNSLTSIGNYAFQGCAKLTSVIIPNNVTSLGGSAFESCSSLTSVTLSNKLENIETGAFYFCSSLASITIPNTVTEIRENAFWGCEKLKNATIGSGVTALKENVFRSCSTLAVVNFQSSSPPRFGVNAFLGIASGAKGYYPTTASSAWGSLTQIGGLTIVHPDTQPPVITLIGANPLTIYKGSAFTDPGATVTDNRDVTRSITGTGTVITATVGNYTLNYNATDAAGNPAVQVTRTVNVVKATPIITAPTAAPITYGQTLASSTLTGGTASTGGTFAFTTPSTAPSAGTAPQSVTFTPTQTDNYNTVTTSVSVTVNKATPTITALPGFMSATGGTKSGSGDFIIHTFTNVGNSTFKPTGSGTVEILVVAGGGGAGFDGGGGGGAGGVITNTVSVTSGTEYTVVVGGGGAAAISPQSGPNGAPGSNSQFGSLTAIGGAGGYNGHAGITAITTGGSGGGQGFIDVGREPIAGGPGLGTSGQGNQGGYSYNGSAGGGGGGAGAVGGNASSGKGGNGGNGIQSDISGVATWYGGGGAGGSWHGIGGTGGMGGGGNGGGEEPATAGANGIANTGGGGGGNGRATRSDSGMGGSGIVIVRYKPNILLTYGQLSGDAAFSGATASVPGSFAFANPSAAVGTSSQSVIFTPNNTDNYNTVTTRVSVTVNKATPTIATPPTATPIVYGQTLAFSTLSGGVASVAGAFAFTTPSTVPSVGTAPQSVTFTPNDTNNYNTETASVSVTVNQSLISSGFSHTLYLGAGATTVTAWGVNSDGRLGVGNMDSPVNWAKAVDGIPAGATVDGLAAGGTHSLILAGGKVYAAGSDRFGQLGQGAVNGTSKSKFTPVVLPSSTSSTPVAVAAGGNHSLIVTASGKVFACGDNTYGQLAQPTPPASSGTLVEVVFPGLSTKIVSVVAGADHNLAVDEGGGVWVWGRNNYGQLGIGKRSLAERTPSKLNLGKINDVDVIAKSVAAGFSQSLILTTLTTDGKVFGFGRNNSGQTGQSATSSVVLVPTLISGLSGIRLISAGTDSSFAIDQAGQLRSWGYNAYGELLLGYASPISSPAVYGPTPSPIATNVFNVAGGGYSTLAVGVQGVIFGGRNDVGQSGNGPDPDEVVGYYYNDAGSLALTNLTMDLAGTIEDPFYDQIFVGKGAVTLNGILNLMFVGTYTGPVYGTPQTFDLIWAKNGIVFGTGYELAFNQAGYLVESAVADKIVGGVSGKVLQATVGAVESNLDSGKADALALAQARLDGLENVSYRVESYETIGVSQLSASPSPVVNRVEMIYSYTRPTGGVMSGAEYFIYEGTSLNIYRVKHSSSSPSGPWVNASVTGATVTPLGKDSFGKEIERVTLRISASGSAGFLRLELEKPQATPSN